LLISSILLDVYARGETVLGLGLMNSPQLESVVMGMDELIFLNMLDPTKDDKMASVGRVAVDMLVAPIWVRNIECGNESGRGLDMAAIASCAWRNIATLHLVRGGLRYTLFPTTSQRSTLSAPIYRIRQPVGLV